MNHEDHEEN